MLLWCTCNEAVSTTLNLSNKIKVSKINVSVSNCQVAVTSLHLKTAKVYAYEQWVFWVAFCKYKITQQLIWYPYAVMGSDEMTPVAKDSLHWWQGSWYAKTRNSATANRTMRLLRVWCIHLIIMLLSGIWLSEFSYTLRVGLLAKMHGNGRMRVYKNSTHSSLTCPF